MIQQRNKGRSENFLDNLLVQDFLQVVGDEFIFLDCGQTSTGCAIGLGHVELVEEVEVGEGKVW